MSNKRLTAVWDISIQKGNKLLALLSLADRSDDDGYCWPSHEDTAERARSKRTYVLKMLAEIEADGEIYVHRRGGKTNKYLVVVGMNPEEIKTAMKKRFGYDDDDAAEKVAIIQGCQQNGHVTSTEQVGVTSTEQVPVQSTEHEPSLNPKPNPKKDSPAPAGKAKPKKRDERLDHPAIIAYRENARLHVPVVWRDEVIETIGGEDKPWGELVKLWVGKGWNPGNVAGMLELFVSEHGAQKKGKTETTWIQHPDGTIEKIEVKR